MHHRPVPADHLSVAVAHVVEGMHVTPPCPSSFDGAVVEAGEFYSWPLLRMRAKR